MLQSQGMGTENRHSQTGPFKKTGTGPSIRKRVSEFVEASALDGFGSRQIVQPVMAHVGGPGLECRILRTNMSFFK